MPDFRRKIDELLYHGILDRAGDPEGLQWWSDRLNEGARWADVQEAFFRSEEFASENGEANGLATEGEEDS